MQTFQRSKESTSPRYTGNPLGADLTDLSWRSRVFFKLTRRLLEANQVFKDRHKSETCYLIGNGVSLKYMDLAAFADRPAIGCNGLFLHRDFRHLNCLYYMIPEPWFYFRYCLYLGKIVRNYLGDVYREYIMAHRSTRFFLSATNVLNMRAPHISYIHNFGRPRNFEYNDMAGVFSLVGGSLYSMIGAAIYMGFQKAILVGCDYTFAPRRSHHFFDYGPGVTAADEYDLYSWLFTEARQRIDLATVTIEGATSQLAEPVDYEALTGRRARYRENTEIVNKQSLDLLHLQNCYTIYKESAHVQ